MEKNNNLQKLSKDWIQEASRVKYFHALTWLGRPIIQVPQDMYALQEIFWKVRPDLIIETGVAHGGSLIFSASMLAILDYIDAVEAKLSLNPCISSRKVVGVDIEIRQHNRDAIEAHPLNHMISLVEGSSVAKDVVDQVNTIAKEYKNKNILVILDSNHTHDHVLNELNSYAKLVTPGSYCVVWDTGVEDLPEGFYAERPWGKGNNPLTAVKEFLKSDQNKLLKFSQDLDIEQKISITAGPGGFLLRAK